MGSSEHGSPHDDAPRRAFPRIELPPVPALGRRERTDVPVVAAPTAAAPATALDGRPVGGQDEAPSGWHYPYAGVIPGESVRQVVPQPVPDSAAPQAAAAPAALTPVVPSLAPAPDLPPDGSTPADDTDGGPSTVVLVLFGVSALALMWASRMAFSAGLLAFASLLMAELSLATSLRRRPGASRPASSTILAVGALVIALNAARHAFAQFGEAAFVAGLFVLVAVVPTLLLLGIAALLLRRASSRAGEALQAWTMVRFGALAALLAAGVQAHRTFSAKPDAIVALAIVALAAFTAVSVLRGTGRAASVMATPA